MARPLDEIDVPDTIQDVIMARLDRLQDPAKKTLPGPLPPWPWHVVSPDRPVRTSLCRTVHGYRDVPRDGDDVPAETEAALAQVESR